MIQGALGSNVQRQYCLGYNNMMDDINPISKYRFTNNKTELSESFIREENFFLFLLYANKTASYYKMSEEFRTEVYK